MSKSLSWTPQRRGLVFCSPACGRGCKIMEYDRALLRGNELAARMGEGWTARVWENLGWHFDVYSPDGLWRVSGDNYGRPSYFIEFGNSKIGQICVASAGSLEEAVRQIKAEAQDKIAQYEMIVASLKNSPLPNLRSIKK